MRRSRPGGGTITARLRAFSHRFRRSEAGPRLGGRARGVEPKQSTQGKDTYVARFESQYRPQPVADARRRPGCRVGPAGRPGTLRRPAGGVRRRGDGVVPSGATPAGFNAAGGAAAPFPAHGGCGSASDSSGSPSCQPPRAFGVDALSCRRRVAPTGPSRGHGPCAVETTARPDRVRGQGTIARFGRGETGSARAAAPELARTIGGCWWRGRACRQAQGHLPAQGGGETDRKAGEGGLQAPVGSNRGCRRSGPR